MLRPLALFNFPSLNRVKTKYMFRCCTLVFKFVNNVNASVDASLVKNVSSIQRVHIITQLITQLLSLRTYAWKYSIHITNISNLTECFINI